MKKLVIPINRIVNSICKTRLKSHTLKDIGCNSLTGYQPRSDRTNYSWDITSHNLNMPKFIFPVEEDLR
jgi:hypothetical protein